MDKEQLTQEEFWDEVWNKIQLPLIIEPTSKDPVTKEIISIFRDFLPKDRLCAVEIGGAPGQYIAYLSKYHGYEVNIIEYSKIGCQRTEENFKLLGLDVSIYNLDFLGDLSNLPRFDLVLSMGFIEHFNELDDIFERHIKLLKKGGILILGVPNFGGINQKVLLRTAPKMLSMHNIEAMNIKRWNIIESLFGLTPLFKGYIGGFEPKILRRCESRTLKNLSIRYFFKILRYLMLPFPFLRKYNSPVWSAYLLGIYKLP